MTEESTKPATQMKNKNNEPVVIVVDEYQEMLANQEPRELSPEELSRQEEGRRIMHEIFLLGRANAINLPTGTFI